MNAQDKLREKVNIMRQESKIEKKVVEAKVNNTLAIVKQNDELAKMYKDNAELGSKNLGGQSPLLKVHTQGRSSTNELAEGGDPNDGWFFYKPTGEQFKEIECHILTISRGFRADGINKKDVFNQLMAGVIVNNGELKPFITYLTGLKLKQMWEFGKEASKYTRAKPIPIPMFTLKVKLTTERVKTDYGNSWIIKFEILQNEDGSPIVVTDSGLFQFLRDHVESVEDTIASIIAAKAPEETIDEGNKEEIPHPAEAIDDEIYGK
jgi:hypothetical protein